MKPDTITPTKRTILMSRVRGQTFKSVSEILNEAAALDAQAAILKAESRERKAQFATLLESGLSAVEASRILMARSAPPPAAPRPEVRPTAPIMPAAVAKAVQSVVSAVIDDAVALRAGRTAFPSVASRAQLEMELYRRCVEVPGLSVSDTVAQSRGWKRWTLKPLEKTSAHMSRQLIVNELAGLTKPVTTKPANTWTKATR